jgi:hypothetical protein
VVVVGLCPERAFLHKASQAAGDEEVVEALKVIIAKLVYG